MIRILTRKTANLLKGSLLKAQITTEAKYIKADGRPLNIAHRGLAGLIPQNTIPAFEAALYAGADFVELDVVYTKDNRLLVMHDPYLHRITNALENQFPHAIQTRFYPSDNKTYTTQWTDLLTLQELRSLKIKQKQAKHRINSLDQYFGMPTLEQVIQKVILFNNLHQGGTNPDKKFGGILIQAKDGDMYRSRHPSKPSIGSKILQVLEKYRIHTWQGAQDRKCPIFLHSFDAETVKEWHQLKSDLPRHLLLEKVTILNRLNLKESNNLSKEQKQTRIKLINAQIIEQASKAYTYCHGLGVEDTLLYNEQAHQPYHDVVDTIKKMQMGLHVWTFKDDSLPFDAKDAIDAYDIGQNQLKLDGIITQFSDTYRYITKLIKNT